MGLLNKSMEVIEEVDEISPLAQHTYNRHGAKNYAYQWYNEDAGYDPKISI